MIDLATRQQLIRELTAKPEGSAWCQRHTNLIDDGLRLSLQGALDSLGFRVSIVAVGGYGRRELSPNSDIDLAIVASDEPSAEFDAELRDLFRALRAFVEGEQRLTLDSSFRPIADIPGLDLKTRTGFLDARLIAGDEEPLAQFLQALWIDFPVGDYVLERIQERERYLQATHSSPYHATPNLKDGAGGLRCVQASNWIRQGMGQARLVDTESYNYVLMLRNVLHTKELKKGDVITPESQGYLASIFEVEPATLMGPLYHHLRENHEVYLETIAGVKRSKFTIRPGVESINGIVAIEPKATLSSAAMGITIASQLGLEIERREWEVLPEVSSGQVIRALSSSVHVLRGLERASILEKLLPELIACRELLPDDITHEYTVFEHTLRVIENLDSLVSAENWLGRIYRNCHEVAILRIAALLHDVGKRIDGPTHHEIGADMAASRLSAIGVEPFWETAVSWLVKHHLVMARVIQVRDVSRPETISDFAAVVENTNYLDWLTLLTWADTVAVSREAWSPVQEAFLQQLYERTSHWLHHGEPQLDASVNSILHRANLSASETSPESIDSFVSVLPADYLLNITPERIREDLRRVHLARNGEANIRFEDNRDMATTEVTIAIKDQPGILSRILGIIYALDASVHSLRAITTQDDVPVALDTFVLSFRGAPLPRSTQAAMEVAMLERAEDSDKCEQFLIKHGKDPSRREASPIYHFHAANQSILEVRSERGRGMAYRLSNWIAEQGWNIVSARLSQWAGQGTATFYLRHTDHTAITADEFNSALHSKV